MNDYAKVPLLFLDIDGTVIKDNPKGGFVNSAEGVHIFPQALALVEKWWEKGGRIVGISNQGGVAAGYITHAELDRKMTEVEKQMNFRFEFILRCTHSIFDMCWCRKPQPGMIYDARERLQNNNGGEDYPRDLALMVGDRKEDEECAKNAGVRFLQAEEWRARATDLG